MFALIPVDIANWISGAIDWTFGANAAVPLVIKATIVLGVALAADFLLQRLPLVRAAAWNGTILLLAALPVAWVLLPAVRLPPPQATASPILLAVTAKLLPTDEPRRIPYARPSPLPIQQALPSAQSTHAAIPAELTDEPTKQSSAASDMQPIACAAVATSSSRSAALIAPALLIVYCCGLAGTLVHLLASLFATVRLRRATQAVEGRLQGKLSDWRRRLGIASAIELRHSSAIEVPIVVGLWRPAIVLPSELVAASCPSGCDAILVHELAHIVRGDARWQFLQRLVAAMYWFHPLLWIANRRIALVRELVCDEYSVFQVGGKSYMKTLLDMASRLSQRSSLSLGMAVVRNSQLGQRLATIHASRGLSRCQSHRGLRLAVLVLGVAVAAWAGRSALAGTPEVPGLPTNAKALKEGFEQKTAMLRAETDRQIAAEREKLEKSLQIMLEDYTRQAKLDEAVAIRDQIRALKAATPPDAASVIIAPVGATMTCFHNRVGESFYVRLVGATTGTVWGTDEYTDDSSLAAAAVHAGVLKEGQNGVVKVTMKPGVPNYAGSSRNGVQSNPWNNQGNYVSYTIESAPPAYQSVEGSVKSDWVTNGDYPPVTEIGPTTYPSQPSPNESDAGVPIDIFPQSVGRSFILKVVGETTGAVWGTGNYTHDSSIATAAVHAGILQPGETGFVVVNVLAGIPNYSGSTQHGVTSRDWKNAGEYVTLTLERLTERRSRRLTILRRASVEPAPSNMTDYQQSVGSSF